MGPNKKNDDELILRVYLGDGESQFSAYLLSFQVKTVELHRCSTNIIRKIDTTYLEVPSAMSPQPIPFDFSGNMTTDLLGYRYDNNPDKKLTLWKNIYNPESDVLFEV